MYNYNEQESKQENESNDSGQSLSSSPSNSYISDQHQRSTYSMPNETYNQYFNYFPAFNYSHYNYSNQYSSYQNLNPYGFCNQSIPYQPVINHQSSPVSQATSPTLQQQTTHVSQIATPVNSSLKPNYVYPTPPSENSTLNSTSSSPTESKSNISILSNEDQEKGKENLKPKEKNGRLVRRRNRVQFNQMQIDAMEAVFDKSHYPEVHVIDRLSDKLGISIERLSIWFQNRRAKFKKTKRNVNTNLSDSLYDLKGSGSGASERARDIDTILSKISENDDDVRKQNYNTYSTTDAYMNYSLISSINNNNGKLYSPILNHNLSNTSSIWPYQQTQQ